MLSKYHAVFLPLGAIGFLLTDGELRKILRGPGPWLALAVGLAAFSPVVAWNASHGWISFAFQGSRATGGALRPGLLAAAVGGQVLYVFPWIWVGLVVALGRGWRGRDRAARLLLWQAIPPLVVFLAVGSRREVLPHWSLFGLVPLFPLLGREWGKSRRLWTRLAFVSAVPAVAAVLIAAQARWGMLPTRLDPTADSVGWGPLLAEARARGLLDRPGQFVFTSAGTTAAKSRSPPTDRSPSRATLLAEGIRSTSGPIKMRKSGEMGSSW